MLCGVVTTGSWLGLAHAVQQSANEGARASLAGLTQVERAALAREATLLTLARTYRIDPNTVLASLRAVLSAVNLASSPGPDAAG